MKICELQSNSLTKIEFAKASVVFGAGDVAIANAKAEATATAITSNYPVDSGAYIGKFRQYSAGDLFRSLFVLY